MLDLERAHVVETAMEKGRNRRLATQGFARTLDTKGKPTRELILFHASEAEHFAVKDNAVKWNGQHDRSGRRQAILIPDPGTEIVFARADRRGDHTMAEPWGLARDHDQCVFDKDATDVRVVRLRDGKEVWTGRYNAMQTAISITQSIKGTLPRQLPEGHEVEFRTIEWSKDGTPIPASTWHLWPDGLEYLTEATSPYLHAVATGAIKQA